MKVLGLDFETTGLSVEKDFIIEVGAILYDTERKAPLKILSELVFSGDFKELDPVIVKLTGITFADLEDYGITTPGVLSQLGYLINQADYVLAHNGTDFDKPFYFSECKRRLVPTVDKPWLDSSVDIPYPEHITIRKLPYLAAEHNFLNPFAHRAIFDVLTMLKILSCYDINEIIQFSKEPNVTLVAKCLKPWNDNGESTNKVKAIGFRWNGDRKIWSKVVKESKVEETIKQTDIPIQVVKE